MRTISGPAPAKINLGLRVLNRGSDGYHELRTIFQTISLADQLRITYDPGGDELGGGEKVALDCDDASVSTKNNLAVRAAESLLQAGGWPGSVAIELKKRIPAGAGLGGGSSDAGAVLLALRRLLKPRPQPEMLAEVAAELGSDVPFFLEGGTAVGLGRGEEVYPLPDQPHRWLVLVAPGIFVSTPEAYRALWKSRARLTAAERQHIINGFRASIAASEESGALDPAKLPVNDFESVVFQQFPVLKEWKKRLTEAGAPVAMMSGSGSAVFGFFSSRRRAREACKVLRGFSGRVYLAETLGRSSYQASWSN